MSAFGGKADISTVGDGIGAAYPVDLESQGVAVIAENTSATSAHQSLASPRACLSVVDVVSNRWGDPMRVE